MFVITIITILKSEFSKVEGIVYFTVTATDGNKAIINANMVNKVIDYGSYRAIYQGSDTNHYAVRDSLSTIQSALNK